jgi:hypothetical protein
VARVHAEKAIRNTAGAVFTVQELKRAGESALCGWPEFDKTPEYRKLASTLWISRLFEDPDAPRLRIETQEDVLYELYKIIEELEDWLAGHLRHIIKSEEQTDLYSDFDGLPDKAGENLDFPRRLIPRRIDWDMVNGTLTMYVAELRIERDGEQLVFVDHG